MAIGYKILSSSLRSVSPWGAQVQYSPEWVDVPGEGAYIALTLQGVLGEGWEPVFAEIEYEPNGIVSDPDYVTASRVRILRYAPLSIWHPVKVAIRAARCVAHLVDHPIVTACLDAAESYEQLRTPAARCHLRAAWAAACWTREALEMAEGQSASARAAAWVAVQEAVQATIGAAAADISRAVEAAVAAVTLATWAAKASKGEISLAEAMEDLTREVFEGANRPLKTGENTEALMN